MARLRPAAVLCALVLMPLGGCAQLVQRVVAGTEQRSPYAVRSDVLELHRSLTVVDLHADALLWNRDLLARSALGHVDVPRMREGGMAVQVFGVVTQVPLFLGLDCNRDRPDVMGALARMQCWPPATYDSPFRRALFQARKLACFARRSRGGLRVIRTRGDLDALLAARETDRSVVGGLLALEGAHALEGRLENVDRLHAAGFRMLGLAHFFDTDVSGSAHGMAKGGLTRLGRRVVERAQALGMAIDLAHASPRAVEAVLRMTTKPVLVSHGGVRATCDSVRNLSDEQIRGIAATGGVIGIGLFGYAVCGDDLAASVRAMRHVADLVGTRHVALGSDWDGATTFVDASGAPLLTEALLEAGFTPREIEAILGGNALRVLRATLP